MLAGMFLRLQQHLKRHRKRICVQSYLTNPPLKHHQLQPLDGCYDVCSDFGMFYDPLEDPSSNVWYQRTKTWWFGCSFCRNVAESAHLMQISINEWLPAAAAASESVLTGLMKGSRGADTFSQTGQALQNHGFGLTWNDIEMRGEHKHQVFLETWGFKLLRFDR